MEKSIKDKINEVKSFLSVDNLKKALEILKMLLVGTSFESDVISLQRRYSDLQKRQITGRLSNDEALRYSNILCHDIISLLDSLSDSKTESVMFSDNFDELMTKLNRPYYMSIKWWLTSALRLIYQLFIVGVIIFSLWAIVIILPDFISSPPRSEDYEELINTSSYSRLHVRGYDNKGKYSDYFVYLTKDFNWKKGEDATSERFGMEESICEHLKTHPMISKINSDELITILTLGNASYEEDPAIQNAYFRLKAEEDRAGLRARKLASCIHNNLTKILPLYTINLGKNLVEATESKYQRLIVVIGIIKNEPHVFKEEAIYNGLVVEYENGNLEFDIRNYSKAKDIGFLLMTKHQ